MKLVRLSSQKNKNVPNKFYQTAQLPLTTVLRVYKNINHSPVLNSCPSLLGQIQHVRISAATSSLRYLTVIRAHCLIIIIYLHTVTYPSSKKAKVTETGICRTPSGTGSLSSVEYFNNKKGINKMQKT